jgi:FkbM family methyltransferase
MRVMIDNFRLLVARTLNAIYYRSGIALFRELSNRLSSGIRVRVNDIYYVLTCTSDLLEVVPEYEKEVFNELFRNLRPGSVFIDVGAHIGRYSFPVARFVGEDGIVVVIEPDPVSFRALSMGVELNGLRNVLALNVALGDREGKATLCQKFVTATSSIIEFNGCRRFVEVPLRRLDSIVEDLGLKRVDVIKIDAEGAEVQVLKGGVKTIMRFRPFIVVEVRNHNIDKFEQIMKNLGYFCEKVVEGVADKVFICYNAM